MRQFFLIGSLSHHFRLVSLGYTGSPRMLDRRGAQQGGIIEAMRWRTTESFQSTLLVSSWCKCRQIQVSDNVTRDDSECRRTPESVPGWETKFRARISYGTRQPTSKSDRGYGRMRVDERCNTEGPLTSWDDGTAKEDALVGLRSEKKELAGLIDDVARRPSGAGGRGR
jgi:hypothetical protein